MRQYFTKPDGEYCAVASWIDFKVVPQVQPSEVVEEKFIAQTIFLLRILQQ